MKNNINDLELKTLAYRYLYYVKNISLISDYEYDKLEREALKIVDEDSMLFQPGSDLESSYSEEIKNYAKELTTFSCK